ncbi:MAG TPA: RluA family pseudouridine synthase [Planctomycetota bacterium]|nr:RluA family pseudouridine synthase [Planctomycetota bacterium]
MDEASRDRTAGAPPIRAQVAPEQAGWRLDVFLARDPRVGSRRIAKELIDRGLVALPGFRKPPKAGLMLPAGQWVEFSPLPAEPEGEPSPAVPPEPLRILHEDAFVLVIDKRPGLPSHPPEGARGERRLSVATLALAHCGDLPDLSGADRPGIVHRLDKDTSGVMVLAKTAEAFHFLQGQFKARTVVKEYRCLSYGEARFDSDWVEAPIADHPTRPERMQVVREGGREAVTYYEVVERFAGFTHFRCLPRTGRTHQIRVHMEFAGYSLVGDKVYRARSQQHAALPPECPPAERQMLHAFALTFDHPWSRERLTFTAPIPPDMERVLAWLRQHRPRR